MPVEFGPKMDVGINSEGYGRIKKVSFDPYNESGSLIAAVERYRERAGRYPPPNVYWETKYTGQKKTGLTAGKTA